MPLMMKTGNYIRCVNLHKLSTYYLGSTISCYGHFYKVDFHNFRREFSPKNTKTLTDVQYTEHFMFLMNIQIMPWLAS